MTLAVDVHQHLWPEELVDRLRARSHAPYLRGWTLHTAGEQPYEVDPADHDVDARRRLDAESGVGSACLSLSSPLGIEDLPRPEAAGLLAAWHDGALALPDHFGVWASVAAQQPDAVGLTELLRHERVVGLQLPATWLATPAGWERLAQVLLVAELCDKPVMVHPGPVRSHPLDGPVPSWWPAVVGYVQQLHAAWWAWHELRGRSLFPTLRLVFAAGAGLAPLHHERHVLRGGTDTAVDPLVYVDSAGYGARGHDALVRALGIDALVLGSDRPYGEPVAHLFGDAATHAVRVTNPTRLLAGEGSNQQEEEPSWAFAS
ncbi:amidohydrolase [Nocardioides mangrovicus]|uniref:Amidohydrolase n=1 Tax=Nocardioides mangrovicus TaxID=2478913 RepID=A0A3L8NZ69_9ACTN|nr:amidohydrolase [Nocardioides mangrovicus]RLV47952.1 amidohydrolase [Nocardioides mangrovicus]